MTRPCECGLAGRRPKRLFGFESGRADGAPSSDTGSLTPGMQSLELEYSRSMVFFTGAGFDEGDEITGSGSAELNDDGTIEVAFAYHLGDEALT